MFSKLLFWSAESGLGKPWCSTTPKHLSMPAKIQAHNGFGRFKR